MQGTIITTTDTFTTPRTIEGAMQQFDPNHERWIYVDHCRNLRGFRMHVHYRFPADVPLGAIAFLR